jgi:RimJ/RimL family protein N-acetyltransferase
MSLPTIFSQGLILRPFGLEDAVDVQRLAGEKAIADTTLNIPHPYADGMAERWIAEHGNQFEEGTGAVFAITDRESTELIGAIGLTIDSRFKKAELGYWVGAQFWNKGYATEAAARVLEFGFEELDLNRIGAGHLARNPASGRVMQKIGMLREGIIRQGTIKWDEFEDLEIYGMLRSDWLSQRS